MTNYQTFQCYTNKFNFADLSFPSAAVIYCAILCALANRRHFLKL